MLISEALINRKNAGKAAQSALEDFIEKSVKQAGAVSDSITNLNTVLGRLDEFSGLSVQINKVNNNITVNDKTLMEAIALRDLLTNKVAYVGKIIDGVKSKLRFSTKDSPLVVVVDVNALTAIRNSYAKELRELDVSIQKVNWTTEIE